MALIRIEDYIQRNKHNKRGGEEVSDNEGIEGNDQLLIIVDMFGRDPSLVEDEIYDPLLVFEDFVGREDPSLVKDEGFEPLPVFVYLLGREDPLLLEPEEVEPLVIDEREGVSSSVYDEIR